MSSKLEKKLLPQKEPEDKSSSSPSFNAMAFRASTDMVAGIMVGTGLGFLADKWFNCAHWGLIIGFLLGAAAGLMNVYKSLCKIGYGFKSTSHRNDKPKK